jgi:peptidoglycan hydrolase CwlO-like protein
VVSVRFGTARVVSARKEKPSQPVPVFNLTVARSHAYLVGADQVLVHNTGCRDSQTLFKERTEELKQKQSELDALQAGGPSSSQQTPDTSKRIAELKEEIRKIKKSIADARRRLKAGPRPTAVDAHTQKLEEIDSDLAKLQSELPSSSNPTEIQRRMDELLKERLTVNKKLRDVKRLKRNRAGEEPPSDVPASGVKRKRKVHEAVLDARRQQRAWKEYESAKTALETTRRELGELEMLPLRTEDERKAAETRKAELKRLLTQQGHDYNAANRVWTWEQEIATINQTQKAGGKRPELEARREELIAEILAENDRTHARRFERKKQGAPNYKKKRQTPFAEKVERMRQQLAALREQPDSPSRAERITHLENAIKKGTELIEVLRKIKNVRGALSRARKRREKQNNNGEDTSAIVQTIAQLEQELALQTAQRVRVRAEALLLGLVRAQRRKPLDNEDAAHLQELQGMLAHPTTLDEGRLTEIARDTEDTVRAEADVLDDAFFEEIWGSWNHDDAPDAARQDPVPDAFETVDEELQAILRSLQQPGPDAGPEPGSPVERTEPPRNPGEAGPSNDPAEGNTQLRLEWQERVEELLLNTRDELDVLQTLADHRNPAFEAELLQRIADLEKNLHDPPF